MRQSVTQAWYEGSAWIKLLYPLSLLFGFVARRKRAGALAKGQYRASVPVIVVGNITAGGTGKTPLCLTLARYLRANGHKVALVSRGYGGKPRQTPLQVTPDTDPALSGDEALLLARDSQCPVIVDPDRVSAVRYAETHCMPTVIISDDGLQHYALGRTVEIAVIDGQRGLGNGLLLPAGPLREAPERLREVDFVVINGDLQRPLPVVLPETHTMTLQVAQMVNVLSGERFAVQSWLKQQGQNPIHAVAGIGNPPRFFTSLRQLGFVIIEHAFPDHHAFTAGDLAFDGPQPVIMTAKDAVKCRAFARGNWWSLEVEGNVPVALLEKLLARIGAPKQSAA